MHQVRTFPLIARLLSAGVLLAGLLGRPSVCAAGGGPENVLLVVNPRSWASRTVANHFIKLRAIPPSNVLDLPWMDDVDVAPVDVFRKQILEPIQSTIDERGLRDQIDYVVYASDFPYRVNFQNDLEAKERFAVGSLTGLTFLAEMVERKNLAYRGMFSNAYATADDASRGFRSAHRWAGNGRRAEEHGRSYLLSTMLAVTSGRGNSVPEVIDYLARAATADGTAPRGTIYFVKNDDIRSSARHAAFPQAVAALGRLGVAAEVLEGVVPRAKRDVLGAMIGARKFDWAASRSIILPGAICEHFTSYGGVFRHDGTQTPLSELLRHGAAGASGTVVEPFAVQSKFPTPMIHAHYARGSTLAEAFYQTVLAPYQLLIVGDPLCRPWAKIPRVTVEGVAAGARIQGVVSIRPSAEVAGSTIDHFELFIDGVRQAVCRPGESLPLDTTALADGHHELRIVAVEASAVASQGRLILPVWVDNHGRTFQFSLVGQPASRVGWREPLVVSVNCPGAKSIEVFHDSRSLAVLPGEQGELSIDARRLGEGPARLRAVASLVDGGQDNAAEQMAAAPILIKVRPRPTPGRARSPGAKSIRGLELVTKRGEQVPIQRTDSVDWLAEAGVGADEPFVLRAWFHVDQDGVRQFQVRHIGRLVVKVDQTVLYDAASSRFRELNYLPASLGEGYHQLEIRGRTDPRRPLLDIRHGGVGSWPLEGSAFRRWEPASGLLFP